MPPPAARQQHCRLAPPTNPARHSSPGQVCVHHALHPLPAPRGDEAGQGGVLAQPVDGGGCVPAELVIWGLQRCRDAAQHAVQGTRLGHQPAGQATQQGERSARQLGGLLCARGTAGGMMSAGWQVGVWRAAGAAARVCIWHTPGPGTPRVQGRCVPRAGVCSSSVTETSREGAVHTHRRSSTCCPSAHPQQGTPPAGQLRSTHR